MYKLFTSPRGYEDSSLGFAREINDRRDEFTVIKRNPGGFHGTILSKDFFGFAGHQKNATFGLGYRLPMKRNNNDSDLSRTAATANEEAVINDISWFVPDYTRNVIQQDLLNNHFVTKIPNGMSNIKRSVSF